MSTTAMNAPSIAATVIHPLGPVIVLFIVSALLSVDSDLGAHARSEFNARVTVQPYQHGNALYDLDEVAGGVVRWKQGESGARRAGKALNVPGKFAVIEGINVHRGSLIGTHRVELIFTEV